MDKHNTQVNEIKSINTPQFSQSNMSKSNQQSQYPYSLLYENSNIKLPSQAVQLDEEVQNELQECLNIQVEQDPFTSDLYQRSNLIDHSSKDEQARIQIYKLRTICEQAILQIQKQYLIKEEQNLQQIISEAERKLIVNTRPRILNVQSESDLEIQSSGKQSQGIDKVFDLIASTVQYSDLNRIPEAKKLLMVELQETENQMRQQIYQEFEQEKYQLIENMSEQITQEKQKIEEQMEEKMRRRIEELTVSMQQKYPEGSRQRAEIQQQIYKDLQVQFEKKFDRWKEDEKQKYEEELSRKTEEVMQNVKNMSQEVLKQHLHQLNEESKQELLRQKEQLREEFSQQLRTEKELKQIQALQMKLKGKIEKDLKEELKPQIEHELKNSLIAKITKQVNDENNKILEMRKKQLDNEFKMKTTKLEQSHEAKVRMESDRKAREMAEFAEKEMKIQMKKQLDSHRNKILDQMEKEFQEKLENEYNKLNDQKNELARIKAAANVQIKKIIDANKNKAEQLDQQQKLLDSRIREVDAQLKSIQYNQAITQSDSPKKNHKKSNYQIENDQDNMIEPPQEIFRKRSLTSSQQKQQQNQRSVSPQQHTADITSSRSRSPVIKENLQFLQGPLPPPWENEQHGSSVSSAEQKQTQNNSKQIQPNLSTDQDLLSRMVQESVSEARKQVLRTLQQTPKKYYQNSSFQEDQEELPPQNESLYSKLLKGKYKTYY